MSASNEKKVLSTQVDSELLDRVRACVRGVARVTGTDFTLVQLVRDALSKECEALEEAHHDGQPWTPVPAPLRPGRRH